MENKIIFIPFEQYNCAKVLISRHSDGVVKESVLAIAEEVGYNKLTEDHEGNYFTTTIFVEFFTESDFNSFKERIRPYSVR